MYACRYNVYMKRAQIQLDEQMFEILRRRAFQERRSLADFVREALRAHIAPHAKIARRSPASFSFIGSGRSRGKGAGTIAESHDQPFAQAIQK